MTQTQVSAAKILLDKALSNAPQITELTGAEGGPVQVQSINVLPVSVKSDG